VLLLLFDVYLTWARIEKATPSNASSLDSTSASITGGSLNSSAVLANGTTTSLGDAVPSPFLATQPVLFQYIFFLALCALETASFHIPIRALLSFQFSRPFASIIPHYPRPALISTALLVSSFTKLFPLLLLVWNYDLPSSASAVSWAVIINNIAALEILLDCGYVKSTLLCGVGAIFRASIGWVCICWVLTLTER
jgi:hypothetical protein